MEDRSTHRKLSGGEAGNDIICFIFVGLFAGQVTKHLCNKFKIPYTPAMALIGIGLGFITEVTGKFGDGAEEISNIDPHTFFLIFLPPLIFESAFSIDWHIIRMELWQILILAGPTLLASSFIIAMIMRYVLWYKDEFSLESAVMFGALISATDPVAVVSLLKEVGASRTLSTLIEGESLFNDGTAFVMFTVTLDLTKGAKFHAGEIAWDFIRLSIGGPLIGVVFGIIVSMWLK